ncbi:hypothetical protein RB653_004557 [Dictyostelium firmibasis]|uniref:DUF7789 domain-containing protein n=1 Tax=Dictyostelium firmibasis TaxID=79012 RepID=A0AAN7Z079_9MYCE
MNKGSTSGSGMNNLSNENKNNLYYGPSSSTYQSQPNPSAPYLSDYNYYNNMDINNNKNNLINDYNNITNEVVKDDELFIDVFPKKKKSEFFDIPAIGKIFVICVFLELVFGLSMLVIRFAKWDGWDDNVKISILGLSCSLFLFYYSFDSIWKENKFQLFLFILIMSTISIGGTYQFYHIWTFNRDIVNSIRFISVLVFIPLNIILGIFSYKKFGWKLYRKIGTSIELRKLYKNYQIFLSLIKIDVFISGLVVSNLTLFYLSHIYEIYINVIVFLLNFAWALFGYHSIKKEDKKVFKIFLFTSWITIGFYIWRMTLIILDIVNGTNAENRRIQFAVPILLFCIISIFERAMVLFYSMKAFSNFNKGLKIVFEKENGKRSKSSLIQQPIIQSRQPIIYTQTNNNTNKFEII